MNSIESARERLESMVGEIEGDDPKVRRRRQILAAATECFAANGYRKTSIDEVAKAAGIAKGTVYLYYANKSELVFACIAAEKLQILDRFAFVFDASIPAATRLRRWLVEGVTVAAEMPMARRLLSQGAEFKAVMAEAPAELTAQSEHDREEILGKLIDQAVGPGVLSAQAIKDRVSVFAGIATFASAGAHSLVSKDLAPRRFASTMADMLLNGILNRGEKKTSTPTESIGTSPAAASTNQDDAKQRRAQVSPDRADASSERSS